MAEEWELTPEQIPRETAGPKETVGPSSVDRVSRFFSPEAVVVFPLAILLDLIGLILICFGLDDFGVTDIIGIIFIGGWALFRSQTLKMTAGAEKTIAKASKRAKRLKWLRPLAIIAECVPYVGAAPCWTILVFTELQA